MWNILSMLNFTLFFFYFSLSRVKINDERVKDDVSIKIFVSFYGWVTPVYILDTRFYSKKRREKKDGEKKKTKRQEGE